MNSDLYKLHKWLITIEDMNGNVGSLFKEVRHKLNISQIEMAKLLGISNVALNRIEKGKSIPRLSTISLFYEIARGNL